MNSQQLDALALRLRVAEDAARGSAGLEGFRETCAAVNRGASTIVTFPTGQMFVGLSTEELGTLATLVEAEKRRIWRSRELRVGVALRKPGKHGKGGKVTVR